MCLFVSVCYFVFDIFALKMISFTLDHFFIYSSPRPETRETDTEKGEGGRREGGRRKRKVCAEIEIEPHTKHTAAAAAAAAAVSV